MVFKTESEWKQFQNLTIDKYSERWSPYRLKPQSIINSITSSMEDSGRLIV